MKKSELKQLIKEEIRKVVSEVGPETAASVLRKGADTSDPRRSQIVKDAVTSVFSKYIGAKKLPFEFSQNFRDSEATHTYELIEVIFNNDSSGGSEGFMLFIFYSSEGTPKEIEIKYNINRDELEIIKGKNENGNLYINRYLAKFLVKAIALTRKMYYSPKAFGYMKKNSNPALSYSTRPTKIPDETKYNHPNKIPIKQLPE
jgi:hypothetical protein